MMTLGSGGRSGTVICTGMTLVKGRKRELRAVVAPESPLSLWPAGERACVYSSSEAM